MTQDMVRPGGRTARVRAAVLRAAGDLLAEGGFDSLDLSEVALRAEVGRTTVYRRWGTPATLIADLLVDMAQTSLPRTDTGSLLGDLTANARLVQRTLTDPRQGPLFKALIAAATSHEPTAKALHHFYETRIDEWAHCVTAAIARGELPTGTDAREVIRAVSAPLYYQLLTSNDPLDKTAADRAARAAAAAATAGAYPATSNRPRRPTNSARAAAPPTKSSSPSDGLDITDPDPGVPTGVGPRPSTSPSRSARAKVT